MDTRDLASSGKLELYVCGLLPDDEARRITAMALENAQISDEINQIERAMIELSSAFAPPIPGSVFNSLATSPAPAVQSEPIHNHPTNRSAWAGWIAAAIFLIGAAYLFKELDERNERLASAREKQDSITEELQKFEEESLTRMGALAVIRDSATVMIPLLGQPISPNSYARVYWNKLTHDVGVDAQGLMSPPQGMAYQVWVLNYKPFIPVSIGLLEDFQANSLRMFGVAPTSEADAFAITLEPVGGSESPTLEQIVVIGKLAP